MDAGMGGDADGGFVDDPADRRSRGRSRRPTVAGPDERSHQRAADEERGRSRGLLCSAGGVSSSIPRRLATCSSAARNVSFSRCSVQIGGRLPGLSAQPGRSPRTAPNPRPPAACALADRFSDERGEAAP